MCVYIIIITLSGNEFEIVVDLMTTLYLFLNSGTGQTMAKLRTEVDQAMVSCLV